MDTNLDVPGIIKRAGIIGTDIPMNITFIP